MALNKYESNKKVSGEWLALTKGDPAMKVTSTAAPLGRRPIIIVAGRRLSLLGRYWHTSTPLIPAVCPL
jgi:hypothetical protein